jgi:ACS family hexuronate transporter-like MFS transporter
MPKKWQLCIVLFLATTLNYLDRQTMSILAPSLAKELHLGNESLGWLFAVFYYAYMFSQMAVGPMLDRSNLRRAFTIAVFLWSGVSVLTGLANGFVALLIFRLALGMVESANWPAGMRVVARLLEPRERALGNGIFTSGTSVGALIAPGLILGIAAAFGWRMAFVLLGSLGMIWIAGWMVTTRDPKLATVWGEPAGLQTKGLAAELRIFTGIIRSPRFVPVLIVSVLVNPCIYYSVNWLPTYFAQQRGLSPSRQMGWILTAIYLGLDLGNLACGGVILALTRWGSSVMAARRAVFILATASLALCAAVPMLPISGAVIALVMVNFGLGIWAAMYLTMAQELSSANVSTAIGILSGFGSLAGALAMWAVGRVTQQTGSFAMPMCSVALASVLAAVAGWAASREIQSKKVFPHDSFA